MTTQPNNTLVTRAVVLLTTGGLLMLGCAIGNLTMSYAHAERVRSVIELAPTDPSCWIVDNSWQYCPAPEGDGTLRRGDLTISRWVRKGENGYGAETSAENMSRADLSDAISIEMASSPLAGIR